MSIAKELLLQLVITYEVSGNRLNCVLHYGASTTLDINDPQQLQLSFETNVLPQWLDCVSDVVTVERMYCRALAPGQCKPRTASLNGKVGTIAEPALPENVALVMQLRQYEESSKHNGRIFISGVTEGSLVDGLFSTSITGGAFATLATTMMSTLNNGSGTNFNLCVVANTFNGIPIVPVGYPVVVVVPTRSPGTQRRRITESVGYH